MTMDIDEVFKCLSSFGSIANQNKSIHEELTYCVQKFQESYDNFPQQKDDELFFKEISKLMGKECYQNIRIKWGIITLFLVRKLHILLEEKLKNAPENAPDHTDDTPVAPPDLLSLKQIMSVMTATKFIFYSSIIVCLDKTVSTFLLMKMAEQRFAVEKNVDQLTPDHPHECLKFHFTNLTKLYRSDSMGSFLGQHILEELFCVLLHPSFSPSEIRNFPDDVVFFRNELEYLFNLYKETKILRILLLIKGLPSTGKEEPYFKKVCHLLFVRRFLMKENGLSQVIDASLQLCEYEDPKRNEAIAILIASAKIPNETEFYRIICDQLVLFIKDDETKIEFHKLLGILTVRLAERSKELAKTYIFDPLLLHLYSTTKSEPSKILMVDFSAELSNLDTLYTVCMPPSSTINCFIKPILHPLAVIAALNTATVQKSQAKRCVLRYLTGLEEEECIHTLLVLSELEENPEIPMLNSNLQFVITNGELVLRPFNSLVRLAKEKKDPITEFIVSILKVMHSTSPRIVQKFYEILPTFLKFDSFNDATVPPTTLYTEEDLHELKVPLLLKLSRAASLLSSLEEEHKLSDTLFRDIESANNFIKALLDVGTQKVASFDVNMLKDSVLIKTLMVLTSFVKEQMTNSKMTNENWKSLEELLPKLRTLKESTSNTCIMYHSEELIIQTLTHTNPDDTCSDEEKDTTLLVESFDSALRDLCYPSIPVIGHGLIVFAKLFRKKDAKTLANKEKLFSLLEHYIKHDDSYIYLSAINALIEMVDIHTEEVCLLLTKQYVKENNTIETRMKIGEVLAKGSERLGPLLPKYRDIFINAMLSGARDKDDLIRASSLSNLADVCKNLRFSIGNRMHEVVEEVANIAKYDNSPAPRRAAILMFAFLIEGLGRDSFKVLKDVIRDLYRMLIRVVEKPGNDSSIVKEASIAIKRIDDLMKEFMFPKESFEKKIYVTEMPPN